MSDDTDNSLPIVNQEVPVKKATSCGCGPAATQPTPAKMDESKEKRKGKKKNKERSLGSARGIETMLRSLYLTQLHLTNIVDNKASMMITINGLILSILLASGGTLVQNSDNHLYLAPIIILLISGLTSMVYAVLSARPTHERCCNVKKVPEDFIGGRANVLYFMDNSDLSSNDYVSVMSKIIRNGDQVYEAMFAHVHIMSLSLRHKFLLLRTAYSVFIIGLGLCTVAFVIVASINLAEKAVSTIDSPPPSISKEISPAIFQQLPSVSGIYEPSGIHQLTDGRIIIVEDEAHRPFSLLTLHANGNIEATSLSPKKMFKKKGPFKQFLKLDDLEGIEVDNNGFIYAITSHSKTENNDYIKKRDKLTRFSISGDQILEPVVISKLREQLINHFPELDRQTVGNRFNIESLSLNKQQNQLLIGFRYPLSKNGSALIATIDNLEALFTDNAPLHFTPKLTYLDLNGNSIRGMAYDEKLDGYLIVGGSVQKGNAKENQLWFWNGSQKALPEKFTIKGLDGIKNAEGVSPIVIDGERKILIVSDDGKEKKGIPASYLLLEYNQLSLKKHQ